MNLMEAYEIVLVSRFSAAHRLKLAGGEFEPLHGHNWRVEVELAGLRLDAQGMLADFTDMEPALKTITGRLHYTHLNDLPAFAGCNPSTENVARHVAEQFAQVVKPPVRIVRVRVWETEDCAAAYVPASELRGG